jgi:hypothetical protein
VVYCARILFIFVRKKFFFCLLASFPLSIVDVCVDFTFSQKSGVRIHGGSPAVGGATSTTQINFKSPEFLARRSAHPGRVISFLFAEEKLRPSPPPSPSFFPFPADKENADVDFSIGRLSFFIVPGGNFMRI